MIDELMMRRRRSWLNLDILIISGVGLSRSVSVIIIINQSSSQIITSSHHHINATEVPMMSKNEESESGGLQAQAASTSSTTSTLESLVASPLFLFNKGSESQQMAQAQEKLGVSVAGSIFIKKIAVKDEDEKAAAAANKRARAPDLAEETENPKKKAKGKAKAKSKAKAKASAEQNVIETGTAEDLAADIVMPSTGGQRQRKWLDDLLSAVRKAAFGGKDVNKKFDSYNSTPRAIAISQALGSALRFAFTGSIVINGKLQKEWSKVGPGLLDCSFLVSCFVDDFDLLDSLIRFFLLVVFCGTVCSQ